MSSESTSPTPTRVALVTGGSKRVGRAIVQCLARAGFDVAIHHRASADEADRLAAEINTLGRRAAIVQADLLDPATWSDVVRLTVDRLGRLDVLVNNASIFPAGPDPDGLVDVALWEQTHRINTVAPIGLSYEARPYLVDGGPGRIVNLLDIAVDRPWPSHIAYCASKAGLANATRSLARAWSPAILVNGVAPGIAVFPDDYSDELKQRLVDRVPLQRAGTPEEMAEAVAFLATSATYMTGQIIKVDGGRSIA